MPSLSVPLPDYHFTRMTGTITRDALKLIVDINMASLEPAPCSPSNHLLRLSIVCLRHYINSISCKNYNIKSAPPSIFYCISLIPDNIIKSFCLCPYFSRRQSSISKPVTACPPAPAVAGYARPTGCLQYSQGFEPITDSRKSTSSVSCLHIFIHFRIPCTVRLSLPSPDLLFLSHLSISIRA